MNSIFRFTLNMHNHRSQASISCFHGDTAIRLIITLVDGVNPFVIKEGCVAILSGTKADGKKLWDRCIIVGNTIQYDFHEQTASCKGVTNCEVTLYDTDGKAITAPKFTIVVDEREFTSADLYSTDHIDAISINRLVAMYDAEEARVTAEANRIEAEESRATAEANRAEAEEARVAAEEARRLAEEERKKHVGKSAYEYAKEGGYTGTEEDFAAEMAKGMPTKISELANDKNFISASGAPVQSVNGKTGKVTLSASDVGARPNTWTPTYSDVGARPNTWTPTYSEVGADKSGTAQASVSTHNTSTGSHNDIRIELKALADRINAILDSDDTTLDELSEIVAYIKSNKSLIEQVTSNKVNYTDIINNLTTNVTNKPLSAAQGVVLKTLIDGLSNDKLDASALASAIKTALAQAKASGEFDGKDGTDGQDGYTPVKGKDYYTDAEKAEWEEYIATELAKRGQLKPEFANSIDECTDTTKLYVLPDGNIYAYMYKKGGEPSFTNLAKPTSDEWQTGKRFKYDGTIQNADTADKTAGAFVSNLFDCKQGDIIRIKGVTGSLQGIGTSAYFTFSGCDTDGNNVTNNQIAFLIDPPSGVVTSNSSWNRVENQVTVTEDGVHQYEILVGQSGLPMSYGNNIVKGRIGGIPTNGAENVIITINEEIVVIPDGYQWVNTGHAFVPADYEDRIVELEEFAEEIEETIKEVVEESATALDYTAYGLPILYLTGDTLAMSKDTKVTLNYVYGDKSGTCTVKWQGSSSLAYEKKNYTITFDNAFEAVEGWGEQKKYCTKANYIDFSHARNVVSAKLWGQVVKSRATGNPRLNALINGGAVDGFPMLIVINGKYQGLYTFNIPKDGWMFGMGNGTNECILCANDHTAGTRFQTEVLCDETDFEIEYITDENNTEWAVDSVNNLINAVIASDGTNIDTVISQYVDIESAIDYLIFVLLVQGGDMYSKNYILSTFDGVKWIFSAYDMDSTYGLWWNGKSFNKFDGSPLISTWETHALMRLLIEHKPEAIKARYKTLRETVMSDANVINEFANFIGLIPKAVLDEDYKIWKGIPSTTVNNFSQIAMHYVLRAKQIDAVIDAL